MALSKPMTNTSSSGENTDMHRYASVQSLVNTWNRWPLWLCFSLWRIAAIRTINVAYGLILSRLSKPSGDVLGPASELGDAACAGVADCAGEAAAGDLSLPACEIGVPSTAVCECAELRREPAADPPPLIWSDWGHKVIGSNRKAEATLLGVCGRLFPYYNLV